VLILLNFFFFVTDVTIE